MRLKSMEIRSKRAALFIALNTMLCGNLLAANILEEVVVEAQKKVETVTGTPIAISAITGEQFEKSASFSFQDITRSTPGLAIESGVTPDIHLRGVSTVTRAGVPLRTNIYQDGALVDDIRAVLDTQFDIERFEILRGPQGTLYGKSSPTGTINIRTKNPNLSEVDGYVSGTVANRNTFNGQFGVSLPIIENILGVRLAGVYDDNQSSGHKNITTDQFATSRGKAGRLTVMFQPTNDFSARLSYSYREKKENPWYVVDGNGLSYDQMRSQSNATDQNDSRDQLTILELNYALGEHFSVVSVTAYEQSTFRNAVDSDASPYPQETQSSRIRFNPHMQEDLRIISDDNDFWDWQIGFFYDKESSNTAVVDSQIKTLPTIGNNQVVADVLVKNIREESAVYSHNTLKFTDELNLILGARYQEAQFTSFSPTTISIPSIDYSATIPAYSPQNYYAVTGTAKLQYFFAPDLVGYFGYDHSFTQGATNLNIAGNLPSNFENILPESSNSIELGLKGNFWDQRGRFSSALYYQDYRHFAQDIVNIQAWTPSTGAVSTLDSMVVNAKEVKVKGLEAEVALLIVDGWDINLSMVFTDSKYASFENNPCTGDVASISAAHPYNTCDLTGDRVPQSSRVSGVFSSNFSQALSDGIDWYFNALVKANTSQIDELTRATIAGYGTTDLFVGLRNTGKSGWDISLWAKNAFDRRVVTRVYKQQGNALPDSAPIAPYNLVFTNTPQQIGVTGTYRF